MNHSLTRDVAKACALGLALGLPLSAEAEAFRDEFQSLDTERWYISDGWSNGEWQACMWSKDMAIVEDGLLRLQLAPPAQDGAGHLCGEIQTQDTYLYGTFEARIKTHATSGVNAAFFTYIGPVHEQPHYEIDVEILTRNPGQVEFNTYLNGEPKYGRAVSLPDGGFSDSAFHTYSFIWEEARLRWYVDGRLMHEVTGPDLPKVAQKLYLSHWNTLTLTDWMGEFVEPGRPLDMEVDWIAYTPVGAGCQFEGSVLCLEGVES